MSSPAIVSSVDKNLPYVTLCNDFKPIVCRCLSRSVSVQFKVCFFVYFWLFSPAFGLFSFRLCTR